MSNPTSPKGERWAVTAPTRLALKGLSLRGARGGSKASKQDENTIPDLSSWTSPPVPPMPLSSWPLNNTGSDGMANVTVMPPVSTSLPSQPKSISDLPWHHSHRLPSSSRFDHGWRPSSPTGPSLLSSPGIFDDIPTSSMDKRSNVSGRCLAAARALDCVATHEKSIGSTLTQCGWEGAYMVQVGFNEEMLRLEQGILQEIHIFLEKDITSSVIEHLATILDPFPVHFHTPSATHCIPELPPQNHDFWDTWTRYGIYRANNQPPVDNDTRPSQNNGDRSFLPGGISSGDGNGSNDGWGDWNSEGSDSGSNDDSDGGSGSNGDGSSTRILNKRVRHKPASRGLSIPFSSTLTCEGEDTPSAPHPSMHFKTHACIDVKMEANFSSKSRPPESNWGGPWLEAKMSLLDAGIQEEAFSGTLGYTLGLSQVRIVASSCPSSILNFSPTTVRAENDDFVAKTERTRKGGIQATLGANPSVRLEGTFGSSSGEEKVQKRWEILPHCLGSNMNDITGLPQTTMMWKYVHNDKSYQRAAGNVFDPRPSATFGLSRAASKMPVLEVEVVMHYSCSTAPSHTFRGWLAGLTLANNQTPAYMNFLHQVSVVVDLEKVERNSWVVGLGSTDTQEPNQLGLPFPPVIEQVESDDMKESPCNVFLGRALYGRVDLAEEERKSARPLLCNTSPPSSSGGSSQVILSPSPSPPLSPSKPSSPTKRGAAEFITKIPTGYVVNGRRFPDRVSALRMATVLKNKANIV